jgi:hypothetical protein
MVFLPMEERSQRRMGCGPRRVLDGAEIMFVKERISSTNGRRVKVRFDVFAPESTLMREEMSGE